MGKSKNLTEDKRSAIVGAYLVGRFGNKGTKISEAVIAETFNCSRGAVQNAVARYKEFGPTSEVPKDRPQADRQRSGRSRVTTPAQDAAIVAESRADRFKTAPQLKKSHEARTGKNVSLSTVKRRLTDNDLHGRVARVKMELTQNHKVKRLSYCTRRQRWSAQRWSRVVFSDELHMTISKATRGQRRYVRRGPGECYGDNVTHRNPLNGKKSVMFWGAIYQKQDGSFGKTQLIETPKTMNAECYLEILKEQLPMIAEEKFGHRGVRGMFFQQDNCPSHTAKFTTNWLNKKKILSCGPLHKFPPKSPDISIIEDCWLMVLRDLNGPGSAPITTLAQLKTRTHEAWAKINSDDIANLYRSLPDRMNGVIAKQGDFYKY